MLAVAGTIARLEQAVDRAVHRRHRVAQPLELGPDIFGDDLADRQPRLVQHRLADRQATD